MGKRFWVALVLVAWVGSALAAGGPAAVRKQVESSMLVKGTIDITADGAVAGYVLKDEDALPSGIRNMVAGVVPKWRFEPVTLRQGATLARATMSLRLVAKRLENEDITIEIRGAHFDNDVPGQSPSSKPPLAPPKYPMQAAYGGVGGTVYTVLKIGRDGRVEEAIAEQVNLRVIANENAMQRWRDLFAKTTLHAAKRWKFSPPTQGEDVDAPYWSVRVPVDFVPPGAEQPQEHKWHAYVPGPRTFIPWRSDESQAGADALAAGGVYPVDGGPKLLTALNPS